MRKTAYLVLLLLPAMAASMQACPVCGPGPGQQASDAASNAILFLLAVILLVIGGIVSFVVSVAVRSRRLARLNEIPEPLTLNSQPPS